jgi:hypothetical protein
MSQKEFRDLFLDNILAFLWRQWSALGVLGEARAEDLWIIDPEPLLLFTLEMGRYEPRLFDEALDWLVINGKWIDLQRLRGILRRKDETIIRLTGAVAKFLVQESDERKWRNTANFCKHQIQDSPDSRRSLFFSKDGKRYPPSPEPDSIFLSCGFNRPKLIVRRLTREVPITSQTTIRFLLRSLFGVGSRAECLVYLLTNDGGHPSEVAKAIGLSIRGTQDTLIDLSRSGLVLTRQTGKRKIEYWLSHERWWEFLSKGSITELKRPIWINWIALFSALSKVWGSLNEISKEAMSDYMRSSKLRDSMEIIGNEFVKSGLDIPPVPSKNIQPQDYEKAFETFINKVFGAK